MSAVIDLAGVPDDARPIAAQAKHILDAFRRHYAGQPRPTRDVLQLEEYVERLSALCAALEERGDLLWLRDDLERRVALMRAELEAVRAAPSGYSPAERASFLASRANQQFALYRLHFAGRSRLSRRPGLLRRVIASLELVLAEMKELDPDTLLDAAEHGANMELVARTLENLSREADVIEAEHLAAAPLARMGALGTAANQESGQYAARFAGRPRSSTDPDELAAICDRLAEIEAQMAELAAAYSDPLNAQNLRIVTRNLESYERELAAMMEPLAPGGAADPSGVLH